VYRLVGALTFFIAVLGMAEWGGYTYLPWSGKAVELAYEWIGLASALGGLWWGVKRSWDGVVYVSAAFFVVYLFCRMHHWLWDLIPNYAFFALLGGLAIGLMLVFRRLRAKGGLA